jgi:hypothetical protein
MKGFKYIILFSILTISLACEDYLDVNTDPTRIGSENISLRVLLPTIIESTSAAQQGAGVNAQLVTHHLDNVQAGYYQEFSSSGAWSEIYLKSLNNLATLDELATVQNAPHYQGIGKVLRAVNLGLLTDTWENAPVTEASTGSENVTPTYDTQEQIYQMIFSDLDAAIPLLGAAESDYVPSNDDMIFGGDMDNWIKTAHALKARFAIHLSNKSSVDYSAILSSVDAGFSSNDDDFKLDYADNQTNPWYNSIAKLLEQSISSQTYGKYLMDIMNGTTYPVFDPRLPLIADTFEGSDNFYGLASYIDDTDYSVSPTNETWYMDPVGPLLIMTYSELKFIEAEAALESGNPTRAQTAYEEGIRSHMQKLGVESDKIEDYLADPAVAVSADLEHIMKEKMIALLFNFETWNDMRRYNFDTSVFKGFFEPNINGRSVPIQRARYPSSEETRNATNASANRKEMTVPMWKDIN